MVPSLWFACPVGSEVTSYEVTWARLNLANLLWRRQLAPTDGVVLHLAGVITVGGSSLHQLGIERRNFRYEVGNLRLLSSRTLLDAAAVERRRLGRSEGRAQSDPRQ